MDAESMSDSDPSKESPEIHVEKEVFDPMRIGLHFIATYGWFLAIGGIVLLYLWKTRFEQQLQRWRQDITERREASEYHKNPDLHLARQEAITAARRRLQEQNDELSALNAVKLKEKEEQKRQEKIKEWEQYQKGKGFRSRTRVDESSSSSQPSTLGSKKEEKDGGRLRGDYNPLMGSGSGTSYRPDRRDCTSSGG